MTSDAEPTGPQRAHPHLAATWWPAEDGGPERLAVPTGLAGPRARSGAVAAVRQAPLSIMALPAPDGDGWLLLRATPPPEPVTSVERLGADDLAVTATSPPLATGPFWPGGMATLADGSTVVVQGRHVHRLDGDLSVERTRELPVDAPHNSFVVLADGSLATKDLRRPGGRPSVLRILDPVTLEDRAVLSLPEPCVARLSATRSTIAVVGVTALHTVVWDPDADAAGVEASVPYLVADDQTYGWDPVIVDGAAWWMDNGEHTYQQGFTMLGNGVAAGPTRLWTAPLAGGMARSVPTSGEPAGAVTNPPVVDPGRGVAVAFDSANGVLAAFDTATLEARWRIRLGAAQHMWLHPDTGELVTNDFVPGTGDHLVVVDIATGEVRARVATDSPTQSVVFGCPGRDRDALYVSLSTVARVVFGD